MTNLIQRITEAIFRQEGEGPLSKNPGNLRGAPWLPNPKIEGGFWVPSSRSVGVAGAAHVVSLHVAEGDTLRGLLGGRPGYGGWAPKSDGNKTEAYIANVKNWAQIPDENQPLWNFIEEVPT